MTTCASVAGSASRCPRTGACSKGSSSSSTGPARSGSPPSWRWPGRGCPVDVHPFTWRQRLTVARGFARYLATIDPASEVPPTDLLPGHRPRITPYVYSEQEIAALMAAARTAATGAARGPSRDADRAAGRHRLPPRGSPRTRPRRCRPGQRRGARARREEQQAAARCRCTRAPSARFALTPACVTPTSRHRPRRRSSCPRGDGGWDARSSTRRSSSWSARSGWKAAALAPGPRPHDLRHAFAVRTLLDWYRDR